MTSWNQKFEDKSYQILLYHGVYPDELEMGQRNSSGKHISRSRFEKEMRILRDSRPIVAMGEIAAAHRGERDLPAGAVAVTFDDGYLNVYEEARPILQRYEVPATIYLATGFIGTGAVMWSDKLESAILTTKVTNVAIETRDRTQTYDLGTPALRMDAIKNIKALCKRLPNEVKDRVVGAVCEQLGGSDQSAKSNEWDHPLFKFMNWDQVREMNASPLIEFGAHTVNHVSLMKVSKDQMRREISESLSAVSTNLNNPCRYFAYPEGQASDFDDSVIFYLRDLGLDHAPSAIDGSNRFDKTDPFHLRRQMVGFEDRPFPITAIRQSERRKSASMATSEAFTLFGRDPTEEVAVIAEIGVNHEGDVEAAAALVKRVADAGADAVKFQSYTPNRFVTTDDAERFERVTKFALDEDDHRYLAKVAKKAGIAFFSSAITEDWIPLIAELGAAIKIASGDLNFEPVIRLAAREDRPLIISTGVGTAEEVGRAIGWIREERAAENIPERLVVMHCISEYPTPIESANLLSIPFLRDSFSVPVGWSNHVIGPDACIAAVALGASVIEVHVTDRREGRQFHDHLLSFEPPELADLVASLRQVRAALGSYEKAPNAAEQEALAKLRKGVAAARDLAAGTVLTRDDLMFTRPATEIPAEDVGSLVGRTLHKAVRIGGLIKRDNLG